MQHSSVLFDNREASKYKMPVNKIETSRTDADSWIVQKFGGTSIGKYPLNVVENVVKSVPLLPSYFRLIDYKYLPNSGPPPVTIE